MNVLVTDDGFNLLSIWIEGTKRRKLEIDKYKRVLHGYIKKYSIEEILFFAKRYTKDNPFLDTLTQIANNLIVPIKIVVDNKKFDKHILDYSKNSDLFVFTDSKYIGEGILESLNRQKISNFILISPLIDTPINLEIKDLLSISKKLKKTLKTLASDQSEEDKYSYSEEIEIPNEILNKFTSQFKQIDVDTVDTYIIHSDDEIIFDLFTELFIKDNKIKKYIVFDSNNEQSLLNDTPLVIQKKFQNRSKIRQHEILEIAIRSNHITFIHSDDKSNWRAPLLDSSIKHLYLPSFKDVKPYISTFLLLIINRIHKIEFRSDDMYSIIPGYTFNLLLEHVTSLENLFHCIALLTSASQFFYTDLFFWLTLDFLHTKESQRPRIIDFNDSNLYYMRFRGSVWEINFGWDEYILINAYLGMYYLAELLSHPGNEYDPDNLRVTITHKSIIDKYTKKSKWSAVDGINLTLKSIKNAIDTVIEEIEKIEKQFELKNSLSSHLRKAIVYNKSFVKYNNHNSIINWNYISAAKTLDYLPLRKN